MREEVVAHITAQPKSKQRDPDLPFDVCLTTLEYRLPDVKRGGEEGRGLWWPWHTWRGDAVWDEAVATRAGHFEIACVPCCCWFSHPHRLRPRRQFCDSRRRLSVQLPMAGACG